MPATLFRAFVLLLLSASLAAAADWKPQRAPLMTRWAKDVSPDKVHPEYPRPQMVREKWLNLNGLWDYAIRPKGDGVPAKLDGQILVPFPVESALSGVMKRVSPDERLWYRRTFTLPEKWKSGEGAQRILLHFGAVDWETTVWINGKQVGTHRGGYDPFSFDVTDALKTEGEQELVVAVWDPSDQGHQPRGKQVLKPRGIWYTPTSGIWQTVWLEPVPSLNIGKLTVTPDVEGKSVVVRADLGPGAEVDGEVAAVVTVYDGDRPVAHASGAAAADVRVPLNTVKLWSPDDPFLYRLKVKVGDDVVESYVGMRSIALGKDEKGVMRILLNGKPVFQYGTLDQGFWPDGLYTAPTDEALKYDIEITKQLGFNFIRKHVKVEPLRWYYWCDKLGILVWQDMPSGEASVPPGKREIERSKESAENFERELKAMIDTYRNHPCIVFWVPFNEGWGQYDTVRITKWVKDYDPSRLVDCASGWHDFPVGDVRDIHHYPGPSAPPPEGSRAPVLGEFGGLGLPLSGHTWQDQKNWGYRTFQTKEELTRAYVSLLERLRHLVHSPGLAAAVYTQTTDVEIEVNGLLTYDREVLKMPEKTLVDLHAKLHRPPPTVNRVVATSRNEPQTWRYTFEKPADGWTQPEFDDSRWKEGPGGFGRPGTPASVVRTEWTTGDIWLRRTFELPYRELSDVRLLLHHDEDADVYLNGVLALRITGYITDYATFPIEPAARDALKPGRNTIAIHCRQTGGGQYIDAGLVELIEQEEKSSGGAR